MSNDMALSTTSPTQNRHDGPLYLYNEDLFTNRREEILKVRAKVVALLQQNADRRVIVFRGPRGSGKSWLVLHLHTHEIPQGFPSVHDDPDDASTNIDINPSDLHSYLLQFDPKIAVEDENICCVVEQGSFPHCVGYEEGQESETVFEILKRMSKEPSEQSRNKTISKHDLQRQSSRAISKIHDRLNRNPNQIYIFLVDSILEKRYHSLLPILEENILDPLAKHPRSLLILTGRDQAVGLRRAHVRPSREDVVMLKPFEKEDVYQQIAEQWQRGIESDSNLVAENIFHWGGGYPEATARLAAALKESFSEEEAANVLNDLIDQILGDEYRSLRPYFEALSTFENGFMRPEAEKAVQNYFKFTNMEPADFEETYYQVLDSSLIFFELDASAYVMNPSLRTAVDQYLYLSNQELWEHLRSQSEPTGENV